MNIKPAILLLTIFFTKVSTQKDRKADLSNSLRKLKNVLHKLQTKQYVVIDIKKVIKSQNVTCKDVYTNVMGCQHSKIMDNPTEETNLKDLDTARNNNCEKIPRGDRKVVCHLAQYQLEELSDYLIPIQRLLMNYKLCTHLVLRFYAYLNVSSNNVLSFVIRPEINHRSQYIKEFQSKGIPVSITLINHDAELYCKNLGTIFSSANLTANFIQDIITKLKSYGLDGLDMEWQNPACCISPCTTRSQQAFLNFMKAFYEQTQKNKMYLSLSLYIINTDYFTRNFAFPEQANYVDWIGLLMFNVAGHNRKVTGHSSHAPSAFSAISSLLKLKTDPKKLLFTYSSYSRTFTLKEKNKTKVGDAITGPGQLSRIWKGTGDWTFYEVCEEVKRKDWKIMSSPKTGNYAFRDNQWISYDDPASVRYKAQATRNLGGMAAWEIDLDDYANLCGCGYFPLLRAASFPDCEVPDCML